MASMAKNEVMLTEDRVAELFAVPLETLRGYRRNGKGPRCLETSQGPRYPLAGAHQWYRDHWLPSRLRHKVNEIEAAEALDAVRV